MSDVALELRITITREKIFFSLEVIKVIKKSHKVVSFKSSISLKR